MTSSFAEWDDQTLDLAIERFTVGMDLADEAALDRATNQDDLLDFENTIAGVHLAFQDVEAPPAEFLNRLEIAGRLQVANHSNPSSAELEPELPTITPLPFRSLAIAGWLVAAGLLLSFLLSQPSSNEAPKTRRATLIADASDRRYSHSGTDAACLSRLLRTNHKALSCQCVRSLLATNSFAAVG